ncbi:RecQ family ATP-dependent DNA helicase [Faecalibacter bovis]|uniref:ATP-dependent DNA helicase RecQ n=1 Tax=Faecalibacter bovis TaxID=2898187 RepID=A0ABX7XBS2_9FLAO|nr:ATP-dependent DNA helicase RecQ [Faecalibacter bovis]QTV05318.1 RecQ family ATP-dependent DNA helicase [Faecalibacter bovis]
MTAKEVLNRYWGHSEFREPQEEIITSVLNKTDNLAVLPTGGGKSLCYQIPALLLPGVTLVISPLIALMKDQVNQLKYTGIPAELISSEYTQTQIIEILDQTKRGEIKLLYVSPERLLSSIFIEHLRSVLLSLIAIDEAHCISEWGHDFRPAYHKIARIKQVFPSVPILALTATATDLIKKEIIQKLQLFEPHVFQSTLKPENLSYHVVNSQDKYGDLLRYFKTRKESAIIFVRNRRQTQEIAQFLLNNNIDAAYFHAKLTKEEKEQRQTDWTKSNSQIMVATNAFGMGIDKADVRTVFHIDLPPSIESYYQEVGRAGRDGKKARGIYLYTKEDQINAENIFKANLPSKKEFLRIANALFSHLIIGEGELHDLDYTLDVPLFSDKYAINAKTMVMFLDFLNTQGVIYQKNFNQLSTIQINIAPQTASAMNNPILDYLQRTSPGIFMQHREISEGRMSYELGQSITEIRQKINELKDRQILEYSDRYLARFRFLVPREDSLFTNKLWTIFENIQISQWKRLQAISFYAEQTENCRERLLLAYFNQKSESNCGHCDVCRKRKKAKDIKQQILDFIATGPKTNEEILTNFITSPKEKILQTLQILIDELKIENEGFASYKIKE